MESDFFFRINILKKMLHLIWKYLLPAICIDSLDNLKDLYGVRFIFFIVKSLAISLQRFHITYKLRCEILQNIKSLDSSDGRASDSGTEGPGFESGRELSFLLKTLEIPKCWIVSIGHNGSIMPIGHNR